MWCQVSQLLAQYQIHKKCAYGNNCSCNLLKMQVISTVDIPLFHHHKVMGFNGSSIADSKARSELSHISTYLISTFLEMLDLLFTERCHGDGLDAMWRVKTTPIEVGNKWNISRERLCKYVHNILASMQALPTGEITWHQTQCSLMI